MMYLGGYFGHYYPPSAYGYGWVDRHTLSVPSLNYAFFEQFKFRAAWLCIPTRLGKSKVASLRHRLRRVLTVHQLPYVLEFFTVYPARHSLYETNFPLPSTLAMNRRILLSFLEDVSFGYGVYHSVGLGDGFEFEELEVVP